MISVIVPTIAGREEWLERCIKAYCDTSPADTEYIVMRDYPTCNQGWNAGILEAKGEFIHLSADDIEPLEGWWQAGLFWIDQGYLPAPRILNLDGSLQSCGDGDWETETGTPTELTRVPFFSREQMEKARIYPIIPTHYMGDGWVTHRGRMVGIQTVVVREMQFVHSFADVGRLDERLSDDVAEFKHAQRKDSIRTNA